MPAHVPTGVRKFAGFHEHTYRLVFPYEDHFPEKAPHLYTILPSGTVENDKVLEPAPEKGLIAYAFPQLIAGAKQAPLVDNLG